MREPSSFPPISVPLNQQALIQNGDIAPQTLVACEECDTLYHRIQLTQGERAYCLCCGAELYRQSKPFSVLLAMVTTALIVFVIANSFPIVKVELQGNDSQTTLLGAAWAMFHAGQGPVGVLILITTFVVPLLDLLLLFYVLSSVHFFKVRPRYLVAAFRTLFLFRTWGMVEVFLIGVLVTLVKLVGMVVVIPGVALWGFSILSVLLVYIASVKVKDLWNEIDRRLS
ncbi:paraquat-inducible protein A [Acinetobacter guillouiae]|uniref:Paraquat-inducible protein A n=1 Tax=Acinetobacter guillouiae TaxID=106649 RepID=A0A8X8KE75_ACIGI|nr:paraquat-inducible protein A [Acinetobacter guillouiae]MCF0264385.1 paraquat-inducible protein A [Acinetobacter guillouiae]